MTAYVGSVVTRFKLFYCGINMTATIRFKFEKLPSIYFTVLTKYVAATLRAETVSSHKSFANIFSTNSPLLIRFRVFIMSVKAGRSSGCSFQQSCIKGTSEFVSELSNGGIVGR